MKKNDIENSALAFVMLGLNPVIVAKYKTDDGTYTVRIDKGRVDFHKPYRPGDRPPSFWSRSRDRRREAGKPA